MRKALTLIFICALTLTGLAQDKGFYYGTRFTLGETSLSGGNLQNPTGKLLWQVGAASAYQFTPNIGLTADFLITGKGTKGTGSETTGGVIPQTYDYNEKINLLNGEVPIAAKLSFGIGNLYLKAYAGPSVNFNFGGFHTLTYDDNAYNDNNGFTNKEITTLETMSTSLVYGAGIDVKSGDGRLFFLDLRLSSSFEPIGTINGADIESKFVGLSAGYLFY